MSEQNIEAYNPWKVLGDPAAGDAEVFAAMDEVERRSARGQAHGGIGYIGVVAAETTVIEWDVSYGCEEPRLVRPNVQINFPNHPA